MPFEILAAGQLEYLGQIPRRTTVFFVTNVMNSRVLRRVAPAYQFGLVGRSVVGDDELKIAVRLRQ